MIAALSAKHLRVVTKKALSGGTYPGSLITVEAQGSNACLAGAQKAMRQESMPDALFSARWHSPALPQTVAEEFISEV